MQDGQHQQKRNAKIVIMHRFTNLTEWLQTTILDICDDHFANMESSYLKPYIAKTDAKIKLHFSMEKNKKERYEGSFQFLIDGEEILYSNDVPFKEPLDVVNHAFKRLKEALANK